MIIQYINPCEIRLLVMNKTSGAQTMEPVCLNASLCRLVNVRE